MELPDHIHHFSWHTKISLELPLGFEEADEDPATNSAMYADDLDEDDEPGARVLAKATAVPGGRDDAYLRIAEESGNVAGRTPDRAPETLEIDGLPAIRQTFRYRQEDIDVEVLRHETFAQIGDVVFSITCLTAADQAARYLPAFDHASDTARFILL